MQEYQPHSNSLYDRKDSEFIRYLKTPLLVLMVPVLLIIMVGGLISGFLSSIFLKGKKGPD